MGAPESRVNDQFSEFPTWTDDEQVFAVVSYPYDWGFDQGRGCALSNSDHPRGKIFHQLVTLEPSDFTV
jgi:hypothetical protein